MSHRKLKSTARDVCDRDYTSRLSQLNDDCLLTLCKYLSFWDVLNLSETSAQLSGFVNGNIVPKYAHNCDLFVVGQRYNLPPISLPDFRRAIGFLGPILRHLSINFKRFNCPPLESKPYLKIVFEHCLGLISLRLFNLPLDNIHMVDTLDGTGLTQLKELHITRCAFNATVWMNFICQLSGLQTLALHDIHAFDVCKITELTDECPQNLRKFSVRLNIKNLLHSSDFYIDLLNFVVRSSQATLRELYVQIDDSVDGYVHSRFLETIAKRLPGLTGLYVRAHPVHTRSLHSLANMQKLRKIVLHGGAVGPSTDWMLKLAARPNRVEHLVLLETLIDRAVWTAVSAFGARLRVLELRRMEPTPLLRRDGVSFAQFSGLHTLQFVLSPSLDGVLLSAIRTCSTLRHVLVRESRMAVDIIERVVDALRSVVEAENAAAASVMSAIPGGLIRQRRLTLEMHSTWPNEFNDLELLQANADILTVVFKKTQFLTRIHDNLPMDEYILEEDETIGNSQVGPEYPPMAYDVDCLVSDDHESD